MIYWTTILVLAGAAMLVYGRDLHLRRLSLRRLDVLMADN
jgi:hypothetical protein